MTPARDSALIKLSERETQAEGAMTYQLYWGDLHSHCSISYGHGTVDQTLARARQQLDFCSITGHAF